MRPVSGGWHQPGSFGPYELNSLLSTEDTAIPTSVRVRSVPRISMTNRDAQNTN